MSGINLFCFTASYVVTLALEVAGLVLHSAWRRWASLGFAAAGLVAQTIYLGLALRLDPGASLVNWYYWCLAAAWVLTALFLIGSWLRPQAPLGLFMIPLVLTLIGVGYLFQGTPGFAATGEWQVFGLLHGFAQLLGAVSVFVGFVCGVMYLVQSWRLSHNIPPAEGFQLPSLEWLQRASRVSLVVSATFLAAGVASGIVLNVHRAEQFPWFDPVVVSSGVLLIWLLGAVLFEWLYTPARQGQKVAYLTIANFLFLCLALGMVWFAPSGHGRGGDEESLQTRRSGEARLGPGRLPAEEVGP